VETQAVQQTAKQASELISQLTGGTINASSMRGKIIIGSTGSSVIMGALGGATSALKQINPLKTLGSGILGLVKNFFSAFKPRNVIRLILALLIALFWLAPTMIPGYQANSLVEQLLSWLTFQQGGMQGGTANLIGGLFGKGFAAATLISVITAPIKTFKSVGGGFNKLFKSLNFKQPSTIGPLLLGVGIALIGYNFMVGEASLSAAMVGVAAFMTSLRALDGRAGFMKNLLGGFFAKNKKVNKQAINSCMAGMATGSALAVVLSAMSWAYGPYVIGAILFVVGLVLAIALRGKKEVAAA